MKVLLIKQPWASLIFRNEVFGRMLGYSPVDPFEIADKPAFRLHGYHEQRNACGPASVLLPGREPT